MGGREFVRLGLLAAAASAVLCTTAPGRPAEAAAPRACSGVARYVGPAPRVLALNEAFVRKPEETRQLDTETSARLAAAFEKARAATGARSMSAAVMVPGRGWWRSDEASSKGADPAPLQYWASGGKAFTAVAILQLVEEGKLRLDDPVSKWIDGVPNGAMISIRSLLNHTNGLFSYNEDPAMRQAPRRLALDEILEVARRNGPLFCPGENWRYSNTGYALLGAVLERVENRPYEKIVADRVLARLGPARLRVVAPQDSLADVAAPAPADGQPPVDARTPGAAGAIVGDAAGMIAFWRAVLGGELLSPATVRAQFAVLYPMFNSPQSYGLGVMTYELPSSPGSAPDVWLGHSGGAPGVKSVFAYSLRRKAFVAAALSGDGSAEATANLLLKQLDAAAGDPRR